ncbi:hypothetical protein EWM64_g10725 [Hericium alpestre]|uniref:Uncharacterized protein n=1 Tax=Hericium alpestre TaxID=135208 RepID=A0A4Y9ZGZ3_9AGAM|nr:hypothetical protein EWM64_g10725 [Hericium alpestre]
MKKRWHTAEEQMADKAAEKALEEEAVCAAKRQHACKATESNTGQSTRGGGSVGVALDKEPVTTRKIII